MSHSLGESALHLACHSGDQTTVELLLDKGLDIEQKRNDGITPLLRAALDGEADAVEFLISKGTSLIWCILMTAVLLNYRSHLIKFPPASIDLESSPLQSLP